MLAFFAHDRLPGYAEAKHEVRRLQSELDRARSTALTTRVRKHISLAEAEEKAARQSEEVLRRSEGYQKARSAFVQLTSKDKVILGLLNEYRRMLIIKLGATNKNATFSGEELLGDSGVVQRQLTPAEYQARDLRLSFRS